VQVGIRLDRVRAEVDIIDQGPGISDAESSKLFDHFYRIDNTRAREAGGFGLGLAIVRAIATIHHAEVGFSGGGDNRVGEVPSADRRAADRPRLFRTRCVIWPAAGTYHSRMAGITSLPNNSIERIVASWDMRDSCP